MFARKLLIAAGLNLFHPIRDRTTILLSVFVFIQFAIILQHLVHPYRRKSDNALELVCLYASLFSYFMGLLPVLSANADGGSGANTARYRALQVSVIVINIGVLGLFMRNDGASRVARPARALRDKLGSKNEFWAKSMKMVGYQSEGSGSDPDLVEKRVSDSGVPTIEEIASNLDVYKAQKSISVASDPITMDVRNPLNKIDIEEHL